MIKPATLWSLFKTCSDPVWLGKLCMSLGGQDVELDFGQTQMKQTIQMDSGWMDERIEAQRERWRERDRRRRDKKNCQEQANENNEIGEMRENGEKRENSQSHASHDTSVRPSVRPSVQTNINTGDVTKGGTGENPPPDGEICQLKYPKEKLMKMCRGPSFALVLKPDEIEPFVDYLIEKGCCEKEANQTVSLSYVKAIVSSWKRDGFADKARHRLTRKELDDVINTLNKDRVFKISAFDADRFWDFLVGSSFTNKSGDLVTKYTVSRILTRWREIETSDKDSKEAEEREKEAREEAIRKIHLSLSENPMLELPEYL